MGRQSKLKKILYSLLKMKDDSSLLTRRWWGLVELKERCLKGDSSVDVSNKSFKEILNRIIEDGLLQNLRKREVRHDNRRLVEFIFLQDDELGTDVNKIRCSTALKKRKSETKIDSDKAPGPSKRPFIPP